MEIVQEEIYHLILATTEKCLQKEPTEAKAKKQKQRRKTKQQNKTKVKNLEKPRKT